MGGFRFVRIDEPVGEGAPNRHFDVVAIQEIINAHRPSILPELIVDGHCREELVRAIKTIERTYISTHHPDGRIDPRGPTLRALNSARASHDHFKPMTEAEADALWRQITGKPPPPPSFPSANLTPDGWPKTPILDTLQPPKAAPKAGAPGATPPAHSAPGGDRQHPISGAIIDAARAAHAKWNVPASITLAQWIVESHWGERMPAHSNNPFGIKAGRGQASVLAWTHEDLDGRDVRMQAPFRVFPNVADAFDAHGRLLAQHPAYALARLHAKDAKSYAHALRGHYCTDRNYDTKLIGWMDRYNLYQYDR